MFAVNATVETILYDPQDHTLLVRNHQVFRGILEDFFRDARAPGRYRHAGLPGPWHATWSALSPA